MLKELKSKIEGAIAASPTLSQFSNQLLIDITTEGLRIQIVDEQNRPDVRHRQRAAATLHPRHPARDRQGR